MNVLFVNSTHSWGGVKTWMLDMARGLQNSGHKVWVFGRSGPFIDKVRSLGIPARAITFGMDFSPLQIIKFIFFCKKNSIDRIVVNVAKDIRSAGIAGRILGIPVVHRVGAVSDLCNRKKIHLVHDLVRPKLLACSQFVKKGLLRKLPFLSEQDISTLFPGKIPTNRPLRSGTPPLTIITTSQLNPDKGHIDLLHALAKAKSEGYSFKVIILGTGKIEKELQKKCSSLGLDPHVSWIGFTRNVESYLDKSDIFILPSIIEPLGQSLQEAMARGLIPIARNSGGVAEIWPKKLSHLLYDPDNNQNALLETIKLVLNLNPENLLEYKTLSLIQCKQVFEFNVQLQKFTRFLLNLK